MSTVRGAVTLLTRIPLGVVLTDGPGAAAFGLVGGFVGLVGAVPLVVLVGPLAEPWLGAIAAVATIAVVTGAMHLDGLADTADALNARDAASAERARKDPALGPAGVVAIGLVLAAEIAALGSLTGTVGAVATGCVLVAVGAISRTLPVLATRLAAGALDGLGAWFAQRITITAVVVAAASAVLIVLGAAWLAAPAGWVVTIAAGGTAIAGALVGSVIVARRGGLDGDGMGAIVELSVLAGLASAALAAA